MLSSTLLLLGFFQLRNGCKFLVNARMHQHPQAWRQHTDSIVARRPLLERCLRTWELQAAAHALDTWKRGVDIARHHRHVLQLVVERRALGLMSATLTAWVAHTRRARQLRVAVERVDSMQARRLLSRCFHGYVVHPSEMQLAAFLLV